MKTIIPQVKNPTKTILLPFLLISIFTACGNLHHLDNIRYVNPMIGTGGDGRISPVAVVPFGMIQLGPDTRQFLNGYHYNENIIIGFSHIHKSGAGCGDMLDLLFMPTIGNMNFHTNRQEFQNKGYESTFNHDNEKVVPGRYSVLLDNGVTVDLTATKRCGFHQYHFPKTDSANIVIDLIHANLGGCSIYNEENYDNVIDAKLNIVNNTTIEGYRISTGQSEEQHVYFVAEFSEPFEDKLILDDFTPKPDIDSIASLTIRSVFRFESDGKKPILVRVGISPVSIDGAHQNLKKEITHWNFDRSVLEAQQAWADELNKFSVQTTDSTHLVLFYTSLYNALMYPSLYSDVDGKYRGPDHKVHQADGYDYMAQVSSLWDTFRAQNPLVTLINPTIGTYHVKTFLDYYNHFGLLPIMPLNGNETFTMLGYHAMPIIADSYYKGLRNYDAEAIFEAMKVSANRDTFGYWLKEPLGTYNYKKYGYIPYETETRSVATTLEYAYDDWCIAQMAKMLKHEDDYKIYLERSKAYKHLFDPVTGFMRAKSMDGKWLEPFDPLKPEHQKDRSYVEGNAWQWTFFVPHDPEGFIELFGGAEAFTDKLDQLFSVVDPDPVRAASVPDMSGLIGQYAHGNEPSHHIPYFYNYAGKAWKTQEIVNRILTSLYKNSPDGLPGNDDTGQLSAWYVFSSIGFYPVRHGNGEYAIGAPLMDKIQFRHTLNGTPKTLTIEAKNRSKKNFYVQSLLVNGKPYNSSTINHDDLFSDDCSLIFIMGDTPNKEWGYRISK
ncbi:GH92 family glycosyl hydrolase [Limibacterium fermenti]|uniref:GH92 family glycosyl hydrolase n=1 Tax=Limibacterium fermenti TaxID=3229863 RepID=UPI000E98B749|nr:sugar hydrolase [Porphyromonadaceae bacterium]